jgi:hypothetical protein
MRWWSRNLSEPGAKLVGFDSFEGLPEDWRSGVAAGHFNRKSWPLSGTYIRRDHERLHQAVATHGPANSAQT